MKTLFLIAGSLIASLVNIPTHPSSRVLKSANDKRDYAVINLTNNSKATSVTADNLNQLLGIGSTLEDSVFMSSYTEENFLYPEEGEKEVQNLYLDCGGIRFGTKSKQGILTLFLKDRYDHVVVTGFAYNQPVYVDPENGITTPQYDEDGNKIVQKWNCDQAELEVFTLPDGDIDTQGHDFKFLTNEGELRAPELTTIDIDFTDSKLTGVTHSDDHIIKLRSSLIDNQSEDTSYQRFVLTKIEVWNEDKSEDRAPAFLEFTQNSEGKYERTVDVNIDDPLSLARLLSTYAKAIDADTDQTLSVQLIDNVKNYPESLKVGIYPLELMATSESGISSFATLNVNVYDDAKPVITGPSEIRSGYSHPKSISNILAEFSVSDNADPTTSLVVSEDTYSANKTTIGTYYITLEATDASGNNVTRIVPVTVYDDAAPVISAPSKILKNDTTILTIGDIEQYVNANDEIDGDVAVQVKSDGFTGNGDKEGTYSVVFIARDKVGNGTSKTVSVGINKSITGNGYLVDNKTLVTYSNKLLTESDINSFLFASGLIESGASETYINVTTDTYSSNYTTLGVYSYAVKIRTTTGTEKIITLDIKVVDSESGTLVKPDTEKWYEKVWDSVRDFFIKLWNLITKGKFEL